MKEQNGTCLHCGLTKCKPICIGNESSMINTRTFYNMFGVYTVPVNVYIDPMDPSLTVAGAPFYFLAGLVGTINVNNALGFQNWCLAANNAALNGAAVPKPPNYWKCDPQQAAAYYNAQQADWSVSPSMFKFPGGIGGPFIPA